MRMVVISSRAGTVMLAAALAAVAGVPVWSQNVDGPVYEADPERSLERGNADDPTPQRTDVVFVQEVSFR